MVNHFIWFSNIKILKLQAINYCAIKATVFEKSELYLRLLSDLFLSENCQVIYHCVFGFEVFNCLP